MKTIISTTLVASLLALITASGAHAQTMLQKVVISNAGATASNSSTQFYYTVGEAAVGTSTNGTTVGQFGFWNTSNSVSGIHNDLSSGAITGMKISPDPAQTTVTVRLNVARAGVLDIQLYDPMGRHVCTMCSGPREEGDVTFEYDVRHLPQGKYIVTARMPGVLMQSQITVVR